MITYIISTFLIGLIFIKLSKMVAIKYDIVDRPNSSVKTHTKVTPYLGGLGIIATFFVSFLLFNTYEMNMKNIIELVALLAMFILGVSDDRFNLSIQIRLIVQFIIAISLVLVGDTLALTGIFPIDLVFTVFGIIFLMNAMNILDILDGLAAGITAIILGAFLILNSFSTGNEFYIFMSIIYITTLVSFLIYNFNPASIFMGDAGSTVLGLFIAIIAINTFNNSTDVSFKFASFIAMSVPIFEVIYVSILRLKKGMSPMHGSKDHFALRKRIMGHSIKETVLLAYGITFMTLITAYIAIDLPLEKLLIMSFGVIVSFIIFGYTLIKVKID